MNDMIIYDQGLPDHTFLKLLNRFSAYSRRASNTAPIEIQTHPGVSQIIGLLHLLKCVTTQLGTGSLWHHVTASFIREVV